MLNIVSALELALYNGRRPVTGDDLISFESGDPTQFKTFEEFWEAFKSQLAWIIEQAIQLNEYFGLVHQEIMPTTLLSALFEGPMEKGQRPDFRRCPLQFFRRNPYRICRHGGFAFRH